MGLLQQSDVANQWFSMLAPGYDAIVSTMFWPDSLQREGLDRLDVDGDDRVLDVGCGTGETTRHLLSRAGSVQGVDLSPDQLASAVEKEALGDADFVAADALSLPYADETFDAVASVGSIMYWEDPGAILREIHRVTKPGGEVLVMGFNSREASALRPVRNVQDAVNSMLFYRHGPTEATDLFETTGWTAVDHEITGPTWSPSLVISTVAEKPA